MAQKIETPNSSIAGISQLTARERECLELVAKLKGSKEIGALLGISHHTVDARLKSAMKKLGTHSRDIAALILAENRDVTVTIPPTNLVSESPDLPSDIDSDNNGSSAGEGDGPGDPEQARRHRPELQRDFGRREGWLGNPHPIATFFGGENRLSIGRRLFIIVVGAVVIAIAFGVLVNGLVGISRVLTSP